MPWCHDHVYKTLCHVILDVWGIKQHVRHTTPKPEKAMTKKTTCHHGSVQQFSSWADPDLLHFLPILKRVSSRINVCCDTAHQTLAEGKMVNITKTINTKNTIFGMYSFHVYEKVIPYILNALISNRNKFSMRTNINVAMEENETSIKKQVKQTLPKSIIVGENWFTQ